MVDAVERLVFIHTLCSGHCSFRDFQQYCSTSRTKRRNLYPWMIEFLSRQFELATLRGLHCPDFTEWPLPMKALYLWLYLPGTGGAVGFERDSIKWCFHVESGELRHWGGVLKRAALYVIDRWVGTTMPDHLMIEAYRFHISPRYIHRIWDSFNSDFLYPPPDATIDELVSLCAHDAEEMLTQHPERIDQRDADLRMGVAMECSFQPAKLFLSRYFPVEDVIAFKTMRALHRYEDEIAKQPYPPIDGGWYTRWVRRLDIACVLDMATPRQNAGGFRAKVILEATFCQPDDMDFWATLERPGLVTEASVAALFEHLDRSVLGDMLPMEWRHRDPWTTLIEMYMSKRRRRK